MADPALLHRFTVEVDAFDLGSFTSCSGLQATYGLDAIVEGGMLGPSVQALKSVTYGDVTVERPLNEQSATVAAWFSAFASSPQPTTAAIAALDPAGNTVCQWNLEGVVPRSWAGPHWASDGSAIAKESLVLAHTGFTLAS
jgi:phage tail-like protein